MTPEITWYGHDSFGFSDGLVQVYIDPWNMPAGAPAADIICITHEHHDHNSPNDVAKLSKLSTKIVVSPSLSVAFPNATVMKPNDRLVMNNVAIEAVAAYNPKKKFHPPDGTRVGYILTVAGVRIYHAGDTDVIPEMADFHPDIALLPVSGTYVMTAEEAAEAVGILKPKQVIPMHYDSIIGTRADAERFAELVGPTCQVTILEKAGT
jgi:L-ascorbate metabolism protein UlaG (beta-lactamase superfamily)